jgi:anti-sigma B factor antagonist
MAALPRRSIEVEDVGDVTVVIFTDKKILDEQTIQALEDQLFNLVDELRRKKLLLNFANVEYLSSAAFGIFIKLKRKLEAAGGQMVCCNIDPTISDYFA